MDYPFSPCCEHPNDAALGSGPRTDALAPAATPNEGGPVQFEPRAVGDAESPRLVTRGESLDTPLPRDGVHPYAALTDWLNVTFPFEGTPKAIKGLLLSSR